MKTIFLIAALFIVSNVFAQSRVYKTRDVISAGTDTTYIYLNGTYEDVTMVIADTTGTPTLTAKVNYGTDTTWYNAYVFTNFNTTAVNLALATPEGNIYQFLDKAIRMIKLYISGGTLTFELKANR